MRFVGVFTHGGTAPKGANISPLFCFNDMIMDIIECQTVKDEAFGSRAGKCVRVQQKVWRFPERFGTDSHAI